MAGAIGIVGLGHAVPSSVRTNDDPLFRGEGATIARELFVGFKERRVLRAGERVEDLGVLAAKMALADAGVEARAIGRLYGAVSPSEHLLPSGLFAIHAELGLPRETSVVPIHSEFTNFVAALACACDAIAAGRCDRALVVVAAGWSRLVDYADAGAAGIGDGAGAVVVARSPRLSLVDEVSETHPEWRHAMTLRVRSKRRADPSAPEGPQPTFVFGEEGAQAFRELAVTVPERLVRRLCDRHGIALSDVALVAHEPTRSLLDEWQRRLQVAELPQILQEVGNATIATSAITLARHANALRSPYVILLGLGLGQNFSAALLRRAGGEGAS